MHRLRLGVAIPLALVAGLLIAAPALAINDALVPGDSCSASGTAVGHPAFTREQGPVGPPPFSLNNPGQSTGAKGSANSQAPCDAP
jgi:hypothetical protein